MDNVQKELLKQIAGLHEIPVGAAVKCGRRECRDNG